MDWIEIINRYVFPCENRIKRVMDDHMHAAKTAQDAMERKGHELATALFGDGSGPTIVRHKQRFGIKTSTHV